MQIALQAAHASMADLPQAAAPVATELDDIETLVRTYRPRLLRFVAFSIGDADLAETITQDCFLKAWNGRASFRGDCSVNTWLTSIALNLIRDQQRLGKFRFWRQARATAIDVTDAASFLPSDESSPERRILAKEQTAQVQAALENLSPNQRTIFLMRFSEEMELAEIAQTIRMPINTVKTHLHRALKSVRAQVASQNSASQNAAALRTAGSHVRENTMNSTSQADHLTEDQLDDALIGDLATGHANHLTACEQCQMRLAEAGAPMAAFSAVSLAWSERRSATLPTPVQSATSAWLPRAIWGATAAAVLAVGVSVPSIRHGLGFGNAEIQRQTMIASTGPVDNPVAARDEQIANDNRMLENIDRELEASAPSPEQEYGLHATRAATSIRN